MILFSGVEKCLAQKFQLQIQFSDDKKRVLNQFFNDTVALKSYLLDFKKQKVEAGFFAASVDSVAKEGAIFKAFFFPGPKFNTNLHFQMSSRGEEAIFTSGENQKKIDFNDYLNNPFQYFESKGYLFAQFVNDSVKKKNDNLVFYTNWVSNPQVLFDSISVGPEIQLKPSFLKSYCRVFPFSPFSFQKVEQCSLLLKELPFIRFEKPYQISLTAEKAKVFYQGELLKTNRLDGIIGFLPNQEQKGKLLFTGEFNLKLDNLFKSAKSFEFMWQSFKARTQKLDIVYRNPAFLTSQLELALNFYLLKEDTFFINRNAAIELNVPFPGKGKLGMVFLSRNSNLLSSPQSSLDSNPVFDSRYAALGFVYRFQNLNNLRLPKRGIRFISSLNFGKKMLTNKSNLQGNEEVSSSQNQFVAQFSLEYFQKIKGKLFGYSRISAQELNSKKLVFNELFRFGGLSSLRGFNENQFFTNRFLQATYELRYFMEEATFLFAFYDGALFQSIHSATGKKISDAPFGTGLGLSFLAQGGQFTISYALGKSASQAFSFSSSKIHFGFVGRF